MSNKTICLAISGASGSQYALRLLQCLLQQECCVHLLISDAAREVARLEADLLIPENAEEQVSFLRQELKTETGKLFCYSKKRLVITCCLGFSKHGCHGCLPL